MKSSERNKIVGSRELLESTQSNSYTNGQHNDDMAKDLPLEFVNYLRSLFDILDQENSGFVKITDIETYWDAKGSSFSSVIESLKQFAPSNGLLDFEHLCRGLKLAIRNSKVNNTRSSLTATNTTKLDLSKDTEFASDSSEDSFKVSDSSKEPDEFSSEFTEARETYSSREKIDSLPTSLSNSNITHIKTKSNSKVYFVGKETPTDGLRGGSKIAPPTIDKKTRFSQVEEELEILKDGLTVIEKARKWYFRRITAVQEEKLHLQRSDQSLEQFQYEMLLHDNRRKELNLTEASFRFYKRNIQEMNKYIAKLIENPLEPLPPPKPIEAAVKPPPEYVQQLRDELQAKSKRISQLEGEKSALIRDLFNAKASIPSKSARIPPTDK